MTPFEAVYGKNPPLILSYMPHVSKVQAVDQTLIVREDILCSLKENLVMTQNHMKQQTDQYHSKHQFVEGDRVFLQLQPYNKTSLKDGHFHKLVPKFYGPSTVLTHVGLVAY
jgi:predicted methyltransferase